MLNLKAACHMHSTWSYDGKWTLEQIATEFRRRKYRVLLMTEHDKGFSAQRLAEYRAACAAASTPEMLVIPGIEYSDVENRIHVLVWGDVPFLGEGLPTREMLRAVQQHGGIAVLAHPSRRAAWQVFSPEWIPCLLGIEIWNRKTDGWAPSGTAGPLLKESSLVPFVGMDFHNARQIFPLATELDGVAAFTEHAVLDSLRARRCRAMAFGRPVASVQSNWLGRTLKSAEKYRRSAARLYRKLRKKKPAATAAA